MTSHDQVGRNDTRWCPCDMCHVTSPDKWVNLVAKHKRVTASVIIMGHSSPSLTRRAGLVAQQAAGQSIVTANGKNGVKEFKMRSSKWLGKHKRITATVRFIHDRDWSVELTTHHKWLHNLPFPFAVLNISMYSIAVFGRYTMDVILQSQRNHKENGWLIVFSERILNESILNVQDNQNLKKVRDTIYSY